MNLLQATRLGVLLLFVHASCASTPMPVEPGLALLRIRVGHKGCESSCHSRARLQLSIDAQDPRGWPATLIPDEVKSDEGAPEWELFEVPAGSEVAISVFAPPHPLVEQWVQIESTATRSITILLEPKEAMEPINIHVDLPSSDSGIEHGLHVKVIAKATGHFLGNHSQFGFDYGLKLPKGTYEVEARGSLLSMCGNGIPRPESFVPERVDLNMESGAVTNLAPQLGSLLSLHVTPPRGAGVYPGMEFLDSPNEKGQIVMGERYAGDGDNLIGARLISLTNQEAYGLTWGWHDLHWVFPWTRVPPGKDIYQIVPVPFGRYELILRGPNIEEYRQEVTLGPGGTSRLRISPQWKSTGD